MSLMKNLDPKIIIVFFIKNFFGTVYIIPLWFLGVFVFERFWIPASSESTFFQELVILAFYGAGWIFLVGLTVGCYYWAWLSFSHFTYELQSDGLHICRGIMLRKEIIIPYTDIESVEVLVNPLVAKVFQLYSVKLITHDVHDTEGLLRKKRREVIPGLSADEAKFFRTELLKGSHIQVAHRTFFDPTTGQYH